MSPHRFGGGKSRRELLSEIDTLNEKVADLERRERESEEIRELTALSIRCRNGFHRMDKTTKQYSLFPGTFGRCVRCRAYLRQSWF